MRTIAAEDLVQRCLDQAPGSWDEFIRRYADLIYSTILRVDLDRSDQEDAFQSTVFAIYRSLDGLRDRRSLVPWIVGIAYRQGMDRLRRRFRARQVPLDPGSGPENTEIDPADAAEAPDEVRLRLERAQQVRDAMAHLPERCRRLIRILFFEDPPLDYTEVARREGIPIGSIGPTRARCIARLRRVFVQEGWIE